MKEGISGPWCHSQIAAFTTCTCRSCSKETERSELATKVCQKTEYWTILVVKYFLSDDGDMRSSLRKQLLEICIVAHVIEELVRDEGLQL